MEVANLQLSLLILFRVGRRKIVYLRKQAPFSQREGYSIGRQFTLKTQQLGLGPVQHSRQFAGWILQHKVPYPRPARSTRRAF